MSYLVTATTRYGPVHFTVCGDLASAVALEAWARGLIFSSEFIVRLIWT